MVQNTPGRIAFFNPVTGAETGHTDTVGTTRKKQEFRPPSVTNKMDVSGWRTPSAWSHSFLEAAPNPACGIILKNKNGQIVQTWSDGAGWDNTMSSIGTFPSSLANRALVKALNKVKNQKVNVAQAFFEREQTVKLFSESVRKIAATVQAFRRKNPKAIWDLVKHEGKGHKVPNSWLEVQYGWRPQLADITNACDILQQKNGSGLAYRVTAVAEQRQRSRLSWIKSSNLGEAVGLHVAGSLFEAAKVHLDYVMESPTLATLAQTGITNPLSLAWELFPYSFIIDYVSNIGDWIGSFDAALGFSFLGGTITYYQKLEEQAWGFANKAIPPANGSYTVTGNPSAFYNRQMKMQRTVYQSSPLPPFPSFKNPLDSKQHLANAVALLASKFNTRSRGQSGFFSVK